MPIKRILFLLFILLCIAGWLWINAKVEVTEEPTKPLTPLTQNIDRILIEKAARKMTVFQSGSAVREYEIALGFTPAGDKVQEGDGKTPEGIYKINRRNPQSSYTLSLGIDYPLPADLERARAGGYSAGGDIFIHGQPNGLKDKLTLKGDWTAGCIALTNAQMQEIWSFVPIGTEVEITP